jgi:hypothetical protein
MQLAFAALTIKSEQGRKINVASTTRRRRPAGALLSKLLELLRFLHQAGGKRLKLVRGGRMRAVSREASESQSELPKIFDDVRSHECVAIATTIGR